MNIEVNLGTVWLPEELVEAVKKEHQDMLDKIKGTSTYDFLLDASFSVQFSTFIQFHYFRLLKEV